MGAHSTGLEHTCPYVQTLQIFVGRQQASRHQLLGQWLVGEDRPPTGGTSVLQGAHCARCELRALPFAPPPTHSCGDSAGSRTLPNQRHQLNGLLQNLGVSNLFLGTGGPAPFGQ